VLCHGIGISAFVSRLIDALGWFLPRAFLDWRKPRGNELAGARRLAARNDTRLRELRRCHVW
jgi:hypothetical protein